MFRCDGIVAIRSVTGAGFSEAQLSDHLHRIEISQGLEDIPALLSDGGDDGAKDGEVVGGKGKNKHADKKLKTGRSAVSKLRSGGTPPGIIVSSYARFWVTA